MARTKNAMIRYQVLDRCFRNPGRRYFWQDLLQACNDALQEYEGQDSGISKRQLYDDIAFMESEAGWAIPLERRKEGKRVYFRYDDISFSINNMPLNEWEVEQLNLAVEALSQFKGMPQFEWIQELLPKLQQQTLPKDTQLIISFDSNPYLKGLEHLEKLYQYILYKKVLKIEYQPFITDEPMLLEFHPYHLRQYNNRWFVFGFNPAERKYNWNLALDRIRSMSELQANYQENTHWDWEEYFEDMVGVTRHEGAKPEEVILHFYGVSGKYVESKPLHGSQKSRWLNPGLLEVKLFVILNYELKQLILSHGKNAQIISPKGLLG